MRITITARHCEVPQELRARARRLIERLARVAPRPHDARVVFDADHGRPSVEVRLHAARGVLHVGTARGADQSSALNLAAAKVRRQLDKSPVRRRAS
jgi:ribosomal subunit interface protein